MADGGTPDQPIPSQPSQEGSTFPGRPNDSLANPTPQPETAKKNGLNSNEWDRLLQLDKLPPSQLIKDPNVFKEFMGLRAKGGQALGNTFDAELIRQKNMAAAADQKRIEDAIGQMEELTRQASQEAHGILEESNRKSAERGAQLDKVLAESQKRVQPKTPEQILAELQKDPKMRRVRADLDWNTLLVGKPVEGTDPELVRRINALKQNASARIMTDPKGWQAEHDALQKEFFQSRGIGLSPNPKLDTT